MLRPQSNYLGLSLIPLIVIHCPVSWVTQHHMTIRQILWGFINFTRPLAFTNPKDCHRWHLRPMAESSLFAEICLRFPDAQQFMCWGIFETEPSSVAQDGLELKTPLSQSLGCWDVRCPWLSKAQSFYWGEVSLQYAFECFRESMWLVERLSSLL